MTFRKDTPDSGEYIPLVQFQFHTLSLILGRRWETRILGILLPLFAVVCDNRDYCEHLRFWTTFWWSLVGYVPVRHGQHAPL